MYIYILIYKHIIRFRFLFACMSSIDLTKCPNRVTHRWSFVRNSLSSRSTKNDSTVRGKGGNSWTKRTTGWAIPHTGDRLRRQGFWRCSIKFKKNLRHAQEPMTESKIQSKPSRKPNDWSSLEQNQKFKVDVVAVKRIRNDVDNSTKSETQSGRANASSVSLSFAFENQPAVASFSFLSLYISSP